MQRQGHDVVFLEDEKLDFNYRLPWIGRKRKPLLWIKSIWKSSWKKYWEHQFRTCQELSDCTYDLLFVINGISLHKSFFKHFSRTSPDAKKVLYLWDNSKFYNYFRYASYFDRIATYDYFDHKEYGAELVPFYWWQKDNSCSNDVDIEERYLLSIIGSNHSGRLDICTKIFGSLVHSGIPKERLMFRILDSNHPENDIVTHTRIAVDETMSIMRQSRCILDTDRVSQSGTTPRLIWALSMGKKIVTTNENISRFPFYNPSQILIIDRNDPVIPESFLIEPLSQEMKSDSILSLRIDNWVRNFLR